MLKLFVFACFLAFAAAKPQVLVSAPVAAAYSTPIAAAYSAPLTYSAYSAYNAPFGAYSAYPYAAAYPGFYLRR